MLCSASQNPVSTGHNEKTTDQFLGEFEKTCCSVSIVDDFGDVFEPPDPQAYIRSVGIVWGVDQNRRTESAVVDQVGLGDWTDDSEAGTGFLLQQGLEVNDPRSAV